MLTLGRAKRTPEIVDGFGFGVWSCCPRSADSSAGTRATRSDWLNCAVNSAVWPPPPSVCGLPRAFPPAPSPRCCPPPHIPPALEPQLRQCRPWQMDLAVEASAEGRAQQHRLPPGQAHFDEPHAGLEA